MCKGMANEWKDSDKWLAARNVLQEALHGGSFTGNSCRILLKKVDLLQSICPLDVMKYVHAFRAFVMVSLRTFTIRDSEFA